VVCSNCIVVDLLAVCIDAEEFKKRDDSIVITHTAHYVNLIEDAESLAG
jgi:hypothetical protein